MIIIDCNSKCDRIFRDKRNFFITFLLSIALFDSKDFQNTNNSGILVRIQFSGGGSILPWIYNPPLSLECDRNFYGHFVSSSLHRSCYDLHRCPRGTDGKPPIPWEKLYVNGFRYRFDTTLWATVRPLKFEVNSSWIPRFQRKNR